MGHNQFRWWENALHAAETGAKQPGGRHQCSMLCGMEDTRMTELCQQSWQVGNQYGCTIERRYVNGDECQDPKRHRAIVLFRSPSCVTTERVKHSKSP